MAHHRNTLLVRCLLAALLIVATSVLFLGAAGDAASEQCATDPAARMELSSTPLLHGAIFECPLEASLRCFGRITLSNEDYLSYSASSACSVCNVASGKCVAIGMSAGTSSGVDMVRFDEGENVIRLHVDVQPNRQPLSISLTTCSRDNSRCVKYCASCSQTIVARCFRNDTAGLTAAIAASPNGGAGNNDNTVLSQLYNPPGTNTSSHNYSFALPAPLDQPLHPRCLVSKLTFVSLIAYRPLIPMYEILLPQDGSSEVVIRNCSSLTHLQAKIMSTVWPGGSSWERTYLQLDGPQLCRDVRPIEWNRQDTAVMNYQFSGLRQLASFESNAPVCSQNVIELGPVVALPPLPELLTSNFTLTSTYTTANSLCSNGNCIGGSAAEQGGCFPCSYTYQVRFACPLNYFSCSDPPGTERNPCSSAQTCIDGDTIYSPPTCADPHYSSSGGGSSGEGSTRGSASSGERGSSAGGQSSGATGTDASSLPFSSSASNLASPSSSSSGHDHSSAELASSAAASGTSPGFNSDEEGVNSGAGAYAALALPCCTQATVTAAVVLLGTIAAMV